MIRYDKFSTKISNDYIKRNFCALRLYLKFFGFLYPPFTVLAQSPWAAACLSPHPSLCPETRWFRKGRRNRLGVQGPRGARCFAGTPQGYAKRERRKNLRPETKEGKGVKAQLYMGCLRLTRLFPAEGAAVQGRQRLEKLLPD